MLISFDYSQLLHVKNAIVYLIIYQGDCFFLFVS